MKEKKSNILEIGVCCKTIKEHYVMLILIVIIQHYYRKHFKNLKRISLRRLTEMAIKDLEARGEAIWTFKKKEKSNKNIQKK